MKRTIKFRAFDTFTKKMWSWDEHNAFDAEKGSIKKWFTDSDLVVMQFTGILDKKGKEVYEGDKFDMTQRYDDFVTFGVVTWIKEDLCWGYLHDDGADTVQGNLMDLNLKEIEVIGNIYE